MAHKITYKTAFCNKELSSENILGIPDVLSRIILDYKDSSCIVYSDLQHL